MVNGLHEIHANELLPGFLCITAQLRELKAFRDEEMTKEQCGLNFRKKLLTSVFHNLQKRNGETFIKF